MTIIIERVGNLYIAKLTPPRRDGPLWQSTEPMERRELIQKLFSLGCHQTDIGDALNEADRKITDAK